MLEKILKRKERKSYSELAGKCDKCSDRQTHCDTRRILKYDLNVRREMKKKRLLGGVL